MGLGWSVSDEDVCFLGDGAGPGVVVWRVCEGVLGAEGDDGWDLGCTVDCEGARAGAGEGSCG